MMMDYRLLFDTIPDRFDRFRPRYCPELFASLIDYAGVGPGTTVLEIGPGTGQATDPILATGCEYYAVELGAHLFERMKAKYARFPNFHIDRDDFVTRDFDGMRFDLIYSAAAIQWIPEAIAFKKTFDLLRPGGTLAMFLTSGDYRTPNEELYHEIQKVYDVHFRPETLYKDMHAPFSYDHAPLYGYVGFEKRAFRGRRTLTADQYVAYCGTHCDHLVIPEPDRSRLFDGLRRAVLRAGDRIVFDDTYTLFLAKKPPNGP